MAIITYGGSASPLQLPNLKLYLSATRMIQQADNSLVSTFSDFSGNNFHATQANTTLQPTFQTNEFGVNSGIKGDGTDDIMTIIGSGNIFRNINQYTVQCVVKRTVLSTSTPIISAQIATAGSVRFFVGFSNTGNITINFRRLDTDSTLAIQIPSNDLSSHIIQVTLNPTNSTVYMYVDGVLAGSQIFASSGSLPDTQHPDMQVVGYNNGLGNVQFGNCVINGISINQAYSDPSIIQQQYKGWLSRGWL